jgi:ABC-2 type transport system ATP-binding protein
VIEVRGLAKTFHSKAGIVEAVRSVDLDVREGELVALLGPNGAGKSTTLRMLTTLLQPTAGTAVVAGHDVRREAAEVRRNIGYIGQGNSAGYYHHVRDEILMQCRAYGLGWRDARRRTDELLATLRLEPMARRTAGTLSGGQRRRLDIALGLVHAPPVLFMDEPSTGLDPQSRAHLWELILGVRERHGTTLLLSTHYLEEADQMAERVMIIDHGRIIANDTPASLKAELAGDRISVRLADPATSRRAGEVAERCLKAREITLTEGGIRLVVADGPGAMPGYLRALDAADIEAQAAEVSRPTLDDVFLTLTGRSLREEALPEVAA